MVERIRTLLESRQLTPTQFADLIGVARPIISHVLSGRNKPSLDVVQRILAALPDLSMAWLLNGTEPMLTTAREAAVATPAITAFLPAEPAALPVAPQQTAVTPTHTSLPIVPVRRDQIAVSQNDNDGVAMPATDWVTAPTPVITGPSAVAAPIVAASPVPGSRPVNPATSRPPMPRRFPVKPSLAEQHAPAAASQAPIAPLPSTPAGTPLSVVGLASSSVGPVEKSVAAFGVENSVIEVVVDNSAAPEKILGAIGTSLAGAVPVVPADAEAVAPVSTPLEAAMPAARIPASGPAPTPLAGAVLNAAPTLATDMATALFTGAEKPIRRIVIFYRDGSFADYQPEQPS